MVGFPTKVTWGMLMALGVPVGAYIGAARADQALQELAQGKGLPLPEYNVVAEVGPDHDKTFVVEVKVGSLVTRCEGSSKKEAQQQAAKHALRDFTGR